MKSRFITTLDKRDLNDKEFALLSPLVYRSELLEGTIVVPKGFVSDGSSTPRLPIVYWMFGDRAHHEAVIHDFIYRSPGHAVIVSKANGVTETIFVSKELADDVFYEAMDVRGKGAFVKRGMWFGVWFGGHSSYKSGPSRYRIADI